MMLVRGDNNKQRQGLGLACSASKLRKSDLSRGNILPLDTSTVHEPLDRDAFARALTVNVSQQQKLSSDALSTLAQEVIERLSSRLVAETPLEGQPDPAELNRFCDALIGEDDTAAADVVMQARIDGTPMDVIYLGYLAGAARQLGERWEYDQTTFMDMTLAAGRIYAIMRGLRRVFTLPAPNTRRHALFAGLPGDDHTLGVAMAADMFRQKGWDIQHEAHQTHDELVESIKNSDHAIIGLSASRPDLLVPLARLVVAVRIAKPHGFVMISGHITEMEPDVVNLVDGDSFATSVPAALAQLEQLIADQQQFAKSVS
ncbi:MAG: B12-binding domain-containing protein [Lysobacterales bacterium]